MMAVKDVFRYWYLHLLYKARKRGDMNASERTLRQILVVQFSGLVVAVIILLHYFGHLVGVTTDIILHPLSLVLTAGYVIWHGFSYEKLFTRQKQAALLRRARDNRQLYDIALCSVRICICLLIVWLILIGGQGEAGSEFREFTYEEIKELLDSINNK